MSLTIIKSNKVVIDNEVKEAFVVIKNGIIADVPSSIDYDVSDKLIDAGDSVLMPGIIDPHVHINEPGRTDWEGFETATKAAISGGITTVVDMPLNSSPVTTTVSSFEQKLAAAKNQLHANCGFWGGIVPGNHKQIEPLIEKGVLRFKAFLTHSGIDEFPNDSEDDLRQAMPIIAKSNLPLLVHCELSTNEFNPTNPRSYQEYLASRPKHWEDKAIALMVRLCGEYDCPVHIVHLSSADSIEQIRKAKERGLPLTVETAQHYLFFHAEQIQDGRTEFKCAPPIREKENNEKLWQALQEGIIDFVATDHSPAIPQLKELPDGDFRKAWGGIASLQFAFPVLWTAAKQRQIPITDVSKWLSINSSKLIRLQKKKGRISRGYDADLAIVNVEKSFEVKEDIILHKHKLTPYLHEHLYGVVEASFLKGEKVFERSSLLQKKGAILLNQ